MGILRLGGWLRPPRNSLSFFVIVSLLPLFCFPSKGKSIPDSNPSPQVCRLPNEPSSDDVVFIFMLNNLLIKMIIKMSSGGGKVGRGLASNTRGHRFESGHQQFLYRLIIDFLLTVKNRQKQRKRRQKWSLKKFSKYQI